MQIEKTATFQVTLHDCWPVCSPLISDAGIIRKLQFNNIRAHPPITLLAQVRHVHAAVADETKPAEEISLVRPDSSRLVIPLTAWHA